jgi:hypothetical protein
MHTLIRTYTFLKYAETQLADARELLDRGMAEDVSCRLADMSSTVLKAFASALPNEKRDLHKLEKGELGKVISDLTFSHNEADEISALVSTVSSNVATEVSDSEKVFDEAADRLAAAEKLLEMVGGLFPARPDRLN